MKDTDEVTREFKEFILECCNTDFPLKGDELEAIIDRYLKLIILTAQVNEYKTILS